MKGPNIYKIVQWCPNKGGAGGASAHPDFCYKMNPFLESEKMT